MAEFGLETAVLIIDASGTVLQETTVRDLLPGAFIPSSLKAAG
jgi:cytidine deaminase